MLYPIGSHSPSLHTSCKIAPTAVIAGSVSLASDVSVWHHAVLRADKDQIQIGAGSNVQPKVSGTKDAVQNRKRKTGMATAVLWQTRYIRQHYVGCEQFPLR